MHLLFEFLPLILFFAAYKYRDIYFAIGVLLVAAPIALAAKYITTKKLDRMMFWSTVLVLVAGGASIYFKDPRFIYWTPTVLYWAAGVVFLASIWLMQKPMARRLYDAIGEFPTEQLEERFWNNLTLVWVAFLLLMGIANIYVALNYPEPTWVNFKVYGLFGISAVFTIAQTVWVISKLEFPDDEEPDTKQPSNDN